MPPTQTKNPQSKQYDSFMDTVPPSYRAAHLLFAYYAAFPAVFSPDLLYQLWLNFREYSYTPQQNDGDENQTQIQTTTQQNLHIVVVSDLLQSGFCREVAFELYEMDEQLAQYLKQNFKTLQEEYQIQTLYTHKDIAIFLLDYTERYLQHAHYQNLRDNYYWKAMFEAFPEQANQAVKEALNKKKSSGQSSYNLYFQLVELQPDPLSDNQQQQDTNKIPVFSYEKAADFVEVEEAGVVREVVRRLGLSAPNSEQTTKKQAAQLLIAQAKTQKLTRLDLGNCDLTDLEKEVPELFELVDLEELILSSMWWDWKQKTWARSSNKGNKNQLQQIPAQIVELQNLRTLIWGGDMGKSWELGSIEQLPKTLPNLCELQLRYCQINDISPLINFPQLERLDLSGNEISDISPLAQLKNLTHLRANGNRISTPAPIAQLQNLVYVELCRNQIADLSPLLPRLLPQKTKTKTGTIPLNLCYQETNIPDYSISVFDNPLTNPPVEIVRGGNAGVLEYWRVRNMATVTTKLLNVHIKPSNTTRVVRNLVEKEEVYVYNISKDSLWCQIGENEFVNRRFLQLSKTVKTNLILQDIANDMLLAEGGTFMMGSNNYEDENPMHSVTLDSFYISRYPVTQAQWELIMGNNPSYFRGDAQCPVENVSWNDIQDFLKKLKQLTGQNYHLPTEAEWEYAARGGNKSMGYQYAGSNNIDEVAWYNENSNYSTHPVGQKKPNELGLYDMSGNVWECCQDYWYGSDYYKNSAAKNLLGLANDSSRVLRGGSWNYFAAGCRVAYRYYYSPGYRISYYGFRLALPSRA